MTNCYTWDRANNVLFLHFETQRTFYGQSHDNDKVLTDILQCNAASGLVSQHLVLSLCGLFSKVHGIKEICEIHYIIYEPIY